ncbi:MAG: hypothetical protein V8T62_04490 [Oscillospiraceae bacterium]
MATVTVFTAFSNCQILFSQYFTNLLKNWQLALRKLPIWFVGLSYKATTSYAGGDKNL